MKKWLKTTILVILLIPVCGINSYAAIGLRGGLIFPQGGFGDLAKSGGTIDITATLRAFPVNAVTIAVAINTTNFRMKEMSYDGLRQESKISTTGGGVGLRLEPPSLLIKPFVEVLGRVASIEQDYKKDSGANSEVNSKTRFGYQINGGIKYAFIPNVGLEVGGSYLVFPNTKFKQKQQEIKTDVKAWGIFVGLRLALGI